EWNRYYDLYVAAAVLFLVALGAAHKVLGTDAALWPTLQAGRLTAARAWPVLTDVFSYTETGRTWVNVPWLFGWLNALIYDAGHGLIRPPIGADTAATSRADQVAAGLLVG